MKTDHRVPNLVPILLIVGGLLLAVAVGFLVGSSQWSDIYIGVWALMGVVSVLWLGSKYWLLIPFSLSFSAPVVPLGSRAVELPELVIMVCVVLFLARLALKAQKLHVMRLEHVPVLLYTAWAALIFAHNRVGFAVFGASSGGARFYLKIFLAVAAFLVVANQKITNRDCKWILIVTVIGTALDFGKTLLSYYMFGGSAMFVDPLENYTWQQELSAVPLALVLILFSRYRAAEIFNVAKIWRPLLLLICIPIILLSGKRSAVFCLFLYPVTATFCRKEFRYVFLCVASAVMASLILIAGQGTLFHLPLTAQRAVSWLPGRWDSELAYIEGGQDDFRARLRELAVRKIQKNPWVGSGYDVNFQATQSFTTAPNKFDAYITQMAIGSSWHNRWLGYAADFGIPASILLAVIYIFVISRSWRTIGRLPPGSLLQTMVMYILIMTVTDAVFSHVSGHSANDASTRWWMYGVLVSIAASLKKERSSLQPAAPRFHRTVIESGPEPVHLPG